MMDSKKEPQSEFCEVDSFNPQNTVEGIIYKSPKNYGKMVITKVNGRDCQQMINTTPKFDYLGNLNYIPQNRELDYITRSKLFEGKACSKIEIFEKVDGTNVAMFFYYDADGNRFFSYKTRLRPFMKASKFGDFLFMWNKLLEQYTEDFEIIKILMIQGNFNVCFEMFGSVNPLLIKYTISLDCRILYLVDYNNGEILSPSLLGRDGLHQLNSPQLYETLIIDLRTELNTVYFQHIDKLELDWHSTADKEGEMWYFWLNDVEKEQPRPTFVAWKCKPPSVVALQGDQVISYNEAYTTCYNALENVENESELFDETKVLLAEVYSEEKINDKLDLIHKAVNDVINYIHFRVKVIAEYQKIGIKFDEITKKQILPILSKVFEKRMMTKVYQILKVFG